MKKIIKKILLWLLKVAIAQAIQWLLDHLASAYL
jgi:hypothetical protein